MILFISVQSTATSSFPSLVLIIWVLSVFFLVTWVFSKTTDLHLNDLYFSFSLVYFYSNFSSLVWGWFIVSPWSFQSIARTFSWCFSNFLMQTLVCTNFLLNTAFPVSLSFQTLCLHLHLFPEIFHFSFDSSYGSLFFEEHVVWYSGVCMFSRVPKIAYVQLHSMAIRKDTRCDLSFELAETCLMTECMAYLRISAMNAWKEYIFCNWGMTCFVHID